MFEINILIQLSRPCECVEHMYSLNELFLSITIKNSMFVHHIYVTRFTVCHICGFLDCYVTLEMLVRLDNVFYFISEKELISSLY